jgi:hypothetical protein
MLAPDVCWIELTDLYEGWIWVSKVSRMVIILTKIIVILTTQYSRTILAAITSTAVAVVIVKAPFFLSQMVTHKWWWCCCDVARRRIMSSNVRLKWLIWSTMLSSELSEFCGVSIVPIQISGPFFDQHPDINSTICGIATLAWRGKQLLDLPAYLFWKSLVVFLALNFGVDGNSVMPACLLLLFKLFLCWWILSNFFEKQVLRLLNRDCRLSIVTSIIVPQAHW